MPALDESFFYKHSGRTGFSIPLLLMIGLPVSAIFAILYAYIVVYCPVVGYVNVLFLGGYVFATAMTLSWIAGLGKCRNATVLFVLGCIAGLVGLYFSWLFFFKALFGEEFPMVAVLGLMISPGTFWEMIMEINKEGWWGPSGIFQWILCAIEAIAFVFGVGLITAGSIDREVFCEDCGKWCKQTHTRHLKFTEEYAESLGEQAEDDGFNHLEILKLPEATEEELPRFDAEVLDCPACDTTALRFKLLLPTEGKDGEIETESRELPGILLQQAKNTV